MRRLQINETQLLSNTNAYADLLSSLIECGMQMNNMISDWERLHQLLQRQSARITAVINDAVTTY
jgi:hypothetical protein